MTEKNVSQVHNETTTTVAAMTDPTGFWRAMAQENVERMEAFFAESERLEAESLERSRRAIEESTRLAHESLAWATRMSAEWRRMVLSGARRAASAG